MGYEQTDGAPTELSGHPIPQDGIGYFKIRLKQAISSQSLRGFSKECGLSEATLRSYLSGRLSQPWIDLNRSPRPQGLPLCGWLSAPYVCGR